MGDALRVARVGDAASQPVGNAEARLDLAQHQDAAVRGELPSITAGDDGLADDR
jgi:hypothetical protein